MKVFPCCLQESQVPLQGNSSGVGWQQWRLFSELALHLSSWQFVRLWRVAENGSRKVIPESKSWASLGGAIAKPLKGTVAGLGWMQVLVVQLSNH